VRILSLETLGVRGLADGTWTFEPDRNAPGHTVIVTGPPHAGLTTFLDAIAVSAAVLAVGGFTPSADDVLRSGGSAARVGSTWWLNADERAFAGLREESTEAEVVFQRGETPRYEADPGLLGLMSRYDHKPGTSKVVLIPARRVTGGATRAFLDFELDQQTKYLSPSADKYAGVPGALARHAAGLGERARFDDAQRLFAELSGTAQLRGVGDGGKLEFTLASGGSVDFAQLGSTERHAFVLAAVPPLLGLARSVVLLDTPEMGLPPGMAARWLDVLRDYAPLAQWIVTTRDPSVVAKVEPSARIELKTRVP
jgi:hypothetical protein